MDVQQKCNTASFPSAVGATLKGKNLFPWSKNKIKINKTSIWIFQPFQEYFTYIEQIVNQRWSKTGVPGEKQSDPPVPNLASHMYPTEPQTTVMRGPLFKGQRS